MVVLHTLGGLSVEGAAACDGFLQRPRVLSLLVLLAGSGATGVARDSVLALLWPESDTCRARASLKQLAFQARRLGGIPMCVGDGGVVRLDPAGVWVDAWEMEAAARRGDGEAIARIHRGPFVDGFMPPAELDELRRWIERRRAAIRDQYEATLTTLCATATAQGDVDALVGYRRHLAELDPLSSRAALSLMRVLVTAGDRPAALAVARDHTRLVRAELDAEPDPSLLRFERELRRPMSADLDIARPDAAIADLLAERARRPARREERGEYWLAGD